MSETSVVSNHSTERAASRNAAWKNGHKGGAGGWIYDANGEPVCQGWGNYPAAAVDRGHAYRVAYDEATKRWLVIRVDR